MHNLAAYLSLLLFSPAVYGAPSCLTLLFGLAGPGFWAGPESGDDQADPKPPPRGGLEREAEDRI